jgi:hypothetical protein
VISEPYVGQGLNPQLKEFWEQTTFKNRVAFLTGSRNTFDNLVENAKRLKAIQQIIDDMTAERVPENDPQFKQADELHDRILNQFLSAVKETFSTLYYPTKQGEHETLNAADFLMRFEGNKYKGEDQVIEVLKDKQKYTEDISSDIFRRKVEQRLFTTEVMLWSEVKKRAATNPQWQWHRRDALDSLKDNMVHTEVWREDGGYIDRSAPPPKTTSVQIQERSRDENSGLVELRVTPVHADSVFAEIGGDATTASLKVENGLFSTDEMRVSFLAVDSTGIHPNGPITHWNNRVTLKSRFFMGDSGERMLELAAAPNRNEVTEIRYTTDGSDPKLAGGVYEEPFAVQSGTQIVLAVAQCDGIQSETLTIKVPAKTDGGIEDKPIDPQKPAVLNRQLAFHLTMETYQFIEQLKRHDAKISGVRISVTGDRWAQLDFHELVQLDSTEIGSAVEMLRGLPITTNGQVTVSSQAIHFLTGQHLLDWLNEVKTDVRPGEVRQ